MDLVEARLKTLHGKAAQAALPLINRGIEREALRVRPDGLLSQRPHSRELGSKLTHRWITTDFSEAQLELITEVSQSIDGALNQLEQIHKFVYSTLEDELLWGASMPCILTGDSDIPLAYYGQSNLGRLKTTYRNGLGLRYGRAMQTISAVHYNFSLPMALWQSLHEADTGRSGPDANFISARYFDGIRNFRRWSWLPIYLFGASPAVCRSFVAEQPHGLQSMDGSSLVAPWGTSLRNGDLGYQSNTQTESVHVSYNSLEGYVHGLVKAITSPYPTYTELGRKSSDVFPQVNDSILQSEAEFYATARAKRVTRSGESFLLNLLESGVEYIEVRLLDIDPYHPLGIAPQTLRFMDTFLLWTLIEDSPQHTEENQRRIFENLVRTVYNGRKPNLALIDIETGRDRSLKSWANEFLQRMQPVAEALNSAYGNSCYTDSLAAQQSKVDDAENTPSGRLLSDMREQEASFFQLVLNHTISHKNTLMSRPLSPETLDLFHQESRLSLERQTIRESHKEMDFSSYLEKLACDYRELENQLSC